MEWIKIEKKWHEMVLRLQITTTHRHDELPRLMMDQKRLGSEKTTRALEALPGVEVKSSAIAAGPAAA
jgi:hypothetical protein